MEKHLTAGSMSSFHNMNASGSQTPSLYKHTRTRCIIPAHRPHGVSLEHGTKAPTEPREEDRADRLSSTSNALRTAYMPGLLTQFLGLEQDFHLLSVVVLHEWGQELTQVN